MNTDATTAINYTLGSYVVVTHDINVAALSVSNLPTSGVAFLRLKLVRTTGDETMDFDTLGTTVKYVGGTAPTLTSGAGAEDFVDIWTEDAGTTWYVGASTGWS